MVVLERAWSSLQRLKPVLLMVVVQTTFASVNVFYRMAQSDGMNLRVIIAYRFVFASAVLVPPALLFERKGREKLDRVVLFQAFLSALFGGALSQNLYLESLALTTVTFASAMTNLVPGITFILAALLRLEKVGITTRAGNAKIFGTLIGIGGAMLLTFYKGAKINIWPTHINLLNDKNQPSQRGSSQPNTVLGALFALCSCFTFSLWLIVQAKMSARYPYPYSCSALMSLMGGILSIIYGLLVERDWSQWKLGWNIRLLTVAYSGMVVSGISFTLITWCVRLRGPLFVSVFYPLMLILSALFGSLLLDEKLHLGSVLGSILIVCGLYLVLWANGKEMQQMSQLVSSTIPGEDEQVKIIITTSTSHSSPHNNIPNGDDRHKAADNNLPKVDGN